MFCHNCAFHLFAAHKFTIIIHHSMLLSSLKQNYKNICTCPQHHKTLLQPLSPPTCILEDMKPASQRKAKFLRTFYYIILKVDFTFTGPCIANVFKYNQQDATLHNSIYGYKCSTCFRRFLRPSSGAQNCIHSIGYLSSFFCFLPLS